MQTSRRVLSVFVLSFVLILLGTSPLLAKCGRLKLRVTPKQAYVFVDGVPLGWGSGTYWANPGEHTLNVYNYGYKPASRNVSIQAGKSVNLDVKLDPTPGDVTGPWGCITIENANRDAILLNGKTPEFFVGHGDEFDHNWWWKQELVVPPVTHQVTVLTADKEVWSGPVEVPANQRVVVDVPKGVRKTVPWPRGEKLTGIPRFKTGTASATVAVAKPSAQLTVTAAQLNCGDSSQIKWTSSDAPHVEITPVGSVAPSGEQAIQPKQTTTYQLTASGPGGTTTSSATVNVNSAIQADLGLSPAEVHYKRVGDKVVETGSPALNWNATNASAVSIEPLGTVTTNGSRTLQVAPHKTDPGPVDETVNYTLTATNGCGGTETRTAALHIVGTIEPLETKLTMRSVYFPTDRPRSIKTYAGLLQSEQDTLKSIAEDFKKLLANKPDAHLVLSGHADKRGPQAYNKPLSERRAELAKRFLIEQGVPEANLETQAFGKEQNLSDDQVKDLIAQNPNVSEAQRQAVIERMPTIVLAYNRRVDLTLSTTGQESARQYPFNTDDYARLVDRNGPAKAGGVELAAERAKMK